MKIIAVPAGENPFDFIMKMINGEGEEDIRVEAEAEQDTEIEADEAEALVDPIVQIRASELAALITQRDEMFEHIEEMQENMVCGNCAAYNTQHLRILAWAASKLNASCPTLKWDDLNPVVQDELFKKAKAELQAFDDAQG